MSLEGWLMLEVCRRIVAIVTRVKIEELYSATRTMRHRGGRVITKLVRVMIMRLHGVK
jgi:hypothetical protein